MVTDRKGRARPSAETRRPAAAKTPAASLPVARVAVDVSLPHLDRPFDYLVSAEQDDMCVPGCRVRVRFSGQLVDGFVLERVEASGHGGRLAYLERVVSPEPVLSADIAALARLVADRWAGSFADVVRLAVPPRHAAVEKQRRAAPAGAARPEKPAAGLLTDYDGGPGLLDAVADGSAPRVVLPVLPGDWPTLLATLAAAALAAGRGCVIVVPDHRDVTRVEAALTRLVGNDGHVSLTADLGPAERYRRFLRVSRGEIGCVVGTRGAVWAPARALGLVIVWDDGDDLHAEPRAPYCHARDVALARAHSSGAAVVVAGFAVTAESALLTTSGWAQLCEPVADARRRSIPALRATGDDEDLARDAAARAARLPSLAWQTARDALAAGRPVLVQVPRRGYQVSLQCASCRAPARCAHCAGPLARPGADRPPVCRWCGAATVDFRCTQCAATSLRAGVVGAARTAEELARAFPNVGVRTSGGDNVVASVGDRPVLVVATPGAEPVADGGYGAALLLDGWALLGRPDLRAGEEALRRWLGAAALVRAAPDGKVVVVASSELRPVQALLRWRPAWHAARELDDRSALHLPPAARVASLTGPAEAVADLLGLAELPPAAEVLGPVPVPGRPGDEPTERMLVRVPRRHGIELATALHAASGVRSARKSDGPVRVEVDPAVIG